MPKAPQGYRWQVAIEQAYVRVELINSSGVTAIKRDKFVMGAWDVEENMIAAAKEIIEAQETAAKLRAKYAEISIGVE